MITVYWVLCTVSTLMSSPFMTDLLKYIHRWKATSKWLGNLSLVSSLVKERGETQIKVCLTLFFLLYHNT